MSKNIKKIHFQKDVSYFLKIMIINKEILWEFGE